MTAGARTTLVIGEGVLADRAVRTLEAALRSGDEDLVVVGVTGSDLDDAALAEAAAPTLFGGATLLVVRDAEAITADESVALVALLQQPPEHLHLAVCHSGAKNRGVAVLKAAKAVAADEIVIPALSKIGDRVEFVRKEFAAARRQISGEAASLLVEAIGSDTGELIAGCSQLLSDTTGRVDVDDVRRYYSGRAEVKGWEVADAAVEGRTADAIASLRAALDAGTAEMLVVGSLAGSLRTIARAASLPRGVRPADAARELGVQPWKVDVVRRQARGWSQAGLADAFIAVAAADAALKGDADTRAKSYALERAVTAVAQARSGE